MRIMLTMACILRLTMMLTLRLTMMLTLRLTMTHALRLTMTLTLVKMMAAIKQTSCFSLFFGETPGEGGRGMNFDDLKLC